MAGAVQREALRDPTRMSNVAFAERESSVSVRRGDNERLSVKRQQIADVDLRTQAHRAAALAAADLVVQAADSVAADLVDRVGAFSNG